MNRREEYWVLTEQLRREPPELESAVRRGMVGVVPAVSQDQITQLIGLVVNILVALGIVVDPTTSGVTDSQQAMTYDKPKVSDQDGGL